MYSYSSGMFKQTTRLLPRCLRQRLDSFDWCAIAGILTTIARREGMTTLREDGWAKIANGTTTVDEVLRVTQEI